MCSVEACKNKDTKAYAAWQNRKAQGKGMVMVTKSFCSEHAGLGFQFMQDNQGVVFDDNSTL
jgi:hypothetical protein